MKSVSLVIPQFERADLTLNCVQSFLEHHTNYEQIIVVDDASQPEQKRSLHALSGPRLSIVPSPVNRGITHAWNLGLKHCTSEIVVLLNNDVITQGKWLDQLVAPISSKQTALCGVATRTETDLPRAIKNMTGHASLLQGWCMAFDRKSAFPLGPFDEQMRLFFSDTDWQCRWIEQYGAECIQYVKGLPIRHLGGQTTDGIANKQPVWSLDRHAFLNKWRTRDASATGL